MNRNVVKITYAEPWLPLHHRLFINIVETNKARDCVELCLAPFRRFSCNLVANALICRKMFKKSTLSPISAHSEPARSAPGKSPENFIYKPEVELYYNFNSKTKMLS